MPYHEHLDAIKASAVGKALPLVIEEAKQTGWKIRVMRQDGKGCIGTADYDPGRINVIVYDGLVTEVVGIG